MHILSLCMPVYATNGNNHNSLMYKVRYMCIIVHGHSTVISYRVASLSGNFLWKISGNLFQSFQKYCHKLLIAINY